MKNIESCNFVFIFNLLIFQNLSVNASIFTLTAIAVDRLGFNTGVMVLRDFNNFRYQAIMFPLRPHISKSTTKVIIVIIWIISLVLAIPMALAYNIVVSLMKFSS